MPGLCKLDKFTFNLRIMKRHILPLLVLLISCSENKSSTTDKVVNTDTLPVHTKPVNDTLNVTSNPATSIQTILKEKNMPDWHVISDADAKWPKDKFDYFIAPKRKDNPEYPYITSGDFNADGKNDFAALITDSGNSKNQLLIILDRNGEKKLYFWLEDILEGAAISTTPKGETEGMESEKTKKVKLKGDAINVEYFETASFLVYWNGNGFNRLQIGD